MFLWEICNDLWRTDTETPENFPKKSGTRYSEFVGLLNALSEITQGLRGGVPFPILGATECGARGLATLRYVSRTLSCSGTLLVCDPHRSRQPDHLGFRALWRFAYW